MRVTQQVQVESTLGGDAFEVLQMRIRGAGDRLKTEIIETLNRAARAAERKLVEGVPRGNTEVLANSIRISPVRYSPGAAGGGGFWEAEVTVGEGVPYLENVVEGTGLYGPKASPIYPTTPGGVMFFVKHGEAVFTRWSRGREPDDLWIIAAQDAAKEEMAEGLRRIDAIHEG